MPGELPEEVQPFYRLGYGTQVLQAVEDALIDGGHQEFATATADGAFYWLTTELARSRGPRERRPGELLGGTLDGTKPGRGIQHALQSVEDVLLDRGFDDWVVRCRAGTWQWQANPEPDEGENGDQEGT